jgi:hypothetical protein
MYWFLARGKKMNRTRNYPTNHVSHPNIGDVTNHEDGTCSFKLNTIPLGGLRTIDVFQGDKRLFSISISDEGVCYQVLQAGQDKNLFTLWEDEV